MAEFEAKLSAISASTLMDLEFMPQEFVVRGLLPPGLSIIGGAPKIGKSWMIQQPGSAQRQNRDGAICTACLARIAGFAKTG